MRLQLQFHAHEIAPGVQSFGKRRMATEYARQGLADQRFVRTVQQLAKLGRGESDFIIGIGLPQPTPAALFIFAQEIMGSRPFFTRNRELIDIGTQDLTKNGDTGAGKAGDQRKQAQDRGRQIDRPAQQAGNQTQGDDDDPAVADDRHGREPRAPRKIITAPTSISVIWSIPLNAAMA